MVNLPTEFGIRNATRYGDMKCVPKCKIGVVRGHPRSSAMSPFLFVFNTNYASILYRFRDTASYLSKFANFDLPYLHLAPSFGVTAFKFRKGFWHQKTRVPGLSCGVVCVIVCLAVLVEHRLVTDRQTQTDGQKQTQGHGIYHAEHSSLQ